MSIPKKVNMCVGLDCDLKAVCKGKYCAKHYARFKRYGDTEIVKQVRGNGYVASTGYRYISVNGQKIGEHVHVAQLKYGRELKSNEIVHHNNHDKLDNRPENLVIMDRGDHVSYHQMKSDIINNTRKCTKCGVAKDLSEFRKANCRSGKRANCKQCDYAYNKDYYHKNKYTKTHLWDLDLSRLQKSTKS